MSNTSADYLYSRLGVIYKMDNIRGIFKRTFGLNENVIVGRNELAPLVFGCLYVVFLFTGAIVFFNVSQINLYNQNLAQIQNEKEIGAALDNPPIEFTDESDEEVEEEVVPPAVMLRSMEELYAENSDVIGWLQIDDSNIDYPVMQTMFDEEYYLNRDFNKNQSANGCLLLDTDSQAGTGTRALEYKDGTPPTTNLIIHGHNMKNGDMFGNLDKYRKQDYEQAHNIIKFKSLYEEREYEIVSVFLSQVYLKSQTDVFKYYQFFQADTQAEFDDFYNNIKDLQMYDTGVTAEFGDEFITLSVCAYHVEDGRLVVVGKRIK